MKATAQIREPNLLKESAQSNLQLEPNFKKQITARWKRTVANVYASRGMRTSIEDWSSVTEIIESALRGRISLVRKQLIKSNFILCVALFLSGGLFGCSTVTSNARSNALNHPSGLPLRYHNPQYNLTFLLPASWRGYSVLIQQWNATQKDSLLPECGPMIVFRHPHWKASDLYQDIPIMMFTRSQWESTHHGEDAVGAGGLIFEMWHDRKYVLGIHSRYNADDSVKRWREAAEIVERNCGAHDEPHLYPQ